MASGMAMGAHARGKRIAFGDRKRIVFSPWSAEVFRHNPNVARPGQEQDGDIEWRDYYKGNRHYNKMNRERTRWIWNYDFKAPVGEIFFDALEVAFAERTGRDYVVIEPNVPWHKTVAPNKDWGSKNYQAVANRLQQLGHEVVQFSHGKHRLRGVRTVETPTYRHALAAMTRASFAILPEGGLHHGAAAIGLPAVVIYGGFIPPQVTGYAAHINLTGGAEACGSLATCRHCRAALDHITVDEVSAHAEAALASRGHDRAVAS